MLIKSTAFTITGNLLYFAILYGVAYYQAKTFVPEIVQSYESHRYLSTSIALGSTSPLSIWLLVGIHIMAGYAIFFLLYFLKKLVLQIKK